MLGEAMEENMLMASLHPDIPLLASRKRPWCLVANGEIKLSSDGLPCHHPDHPPRPASHGGAGVAGGAPAVRQAARLSPGARLAGRQAETCVQTGSA